MENAYNFKKYTNGDISQPFDFWSIMMYRKDAFSNNGRDTITTLNPEYKNVIGQTDRMSADDISNIKEKYECEE